MAATAGLNRRLICDSDALVDGGHGLRFTVDRSGIAEPAFAVRYRGQVHAFLNRCGHIPVELDWQQGEFFDHSGLYLICATHGALYAPDSGHCMGGRCNGKGLVALSVLEDGGQIFLIEEGRQSVG
ncbi:Rieske (2Fe-2S) protein [Sulfuritalea sp.]|uniref:Rieske (2Fe-2S) protein n=1 Tax=Sulfuritalea sp. TaxID=2480090 RepID=UPI00286E535D|nr:Rieske 2Fe-2S domain-containing protein [Sulfuritalea sp.]